MEIKLESLQFFAYHGCFAEEQAIGTHFLVDVAIEYNATQCEISDDLQFALNYQAVYMLVKSEMMKTSKLLENVVYRMIQSIAKTFSKFNMQTIAVSISKLNPALAVGGKVQKVTVSKTVVLNSHAH